MVRPFESTIVPSALPIPFELPANSGATAHDVVESRLIHVALST